MFSTSFVSRTRNSPDLRHGLIFVAVADSRTETVDQTVKPVTRSTNGVAHITVPNALLGLQCGLMLVLELFGARFDESLHRQYRQREHVEIAHDRDPGREVQRADDDAER